MNKLKQLCLLTLVLIFSCSCNRLVSADYDTIDTGTITDVDKTANNLTIQSFQSGATHIWYVDRAELDALSMYGGEYRDKLKQGDTVYVYRDGGEIFVSKRSIADAKAINTALCDYYWLNLGKQWYWLLLIFVVAACVMVYCSESFFSLLILAAGWGALLMLSNIDNKLEYTSEGTITRIASCYVELDNSVIVPYATLNDIATHNPVCLGEKVSLYNYRASLSSAENKIFFSTRKLNQEALQATQAYPEIFLRTTVLYWFFTVITQIPFVYLKDRRKAKKRPENA